jgi:hypothetical protein
MNGHTIQSHLALWLKEHSNPYIGIERSWEEYCNEVLNIEHKETYGVIASTLQIHQIRVKQLEEALNNIQK